MTDFLEALKCYGSRLREIDPIEINHHVIRFSASCSAKSCKVI
jgi:hypothetical protein